MAQDNKSLGRFILDNIPPAPRGIPQIEVTFDVDANGILNVKAQDKASGKEQSIRIEASSGLSDQDIKKMKEDAETHTEEDNKKKELADIRNTAEMMLFTAEKSVKDYGDKVSAEVKTEIENKISELRKVKEENDIEIIKKATEDLSAEMSKIGEAMAKEEKKPEENKTEENKVPEEQNSEIKNAEVNESPDEDKK